MRSFIFLIQSLTSIFPSFILFAGDLILNIGNPATDAIPIGTRVALAFLSAAAVRSAGFQGVAVSALAPGVQYVLAGHSRFDGSMADIGSRVLYVIMMYIAIYPIAMR